MTKRTFRILALLLFITQCVSAQITLQILPQSQADKNFRVGGMAGFSITSPPSDTIWSEDGVPPGAVTGGDSEGWSWVISNPSPFSGGSAHQSAALAGLHQHYFYWAPPLNINMGDMLVAYVYLDPASVPTQVMLQWNDGTWEHRAYWGANQLPWGTDRTSSRYYMGTLPPAGQWVRLEVPASAVGLEGRALNGMAFSLYGGRATWDHAGKFSWPSTPTDVTWVEDSVPAGAVQEGTSETWNWKSYNPKVETGPAPYSGLYDHPSNLISGVHQHDFYGATNSLPINAGDSLFAYVYLDPSSPPTEVMLQWNDGTWEHRAYWGANQIGWGADGTTSRRYMGALPPAGQWIRLEVPGSQVGLAGRTLNGMAFTLYGGRAIWDRAGKSLIVPPPGDVVWSEDGMPAGATPSGTSEGWTWIGSNPSPFSGSSAHQSSNLTGLHQHFFTGATNTLIVNAGDSLVAYVYLDPASKPSQMMLQWNDGNWEHRAYWAATAGSSAFPWGTERTNSRYYMGPLPPAGQWVRLEVPASAVGLEGRTLNGMAFALYGGRATWDHAGKFSTYPSDEYRVYATTSLPRGRWLDSQNTRDYFWESQSTGNDPSTDLDNCSVQHDPRTWNPRCIDNVVLLTKNVSCGSANPTYACQGNDLWNGHPGRFNMSTFPVRPPVDDNGFGWPSNNSWGVKGFTPIVTKDIVNSLQPSPPLTGVAGWCHPSNPGDFATGAANSEVTQVKFADGTTRWFMAYNNQIHSEENNGLNGADLWRIQWAYSNDGKTWTPENRPLIRDTSESSRNCWQGILLTDMFVDTDATDPLHPQPYFYMAATIVLTEHVWLLRSPVVQSSVPGYDTSLGWEVRGDVDPATGKNRWIRIPPSMLGTEIDFYSLGAKSIVPSHFPGSYGGLVKQTVIGRIFSSYQPNSPSKYLALTVDKNGTGPDLLELWATDDLNKPFVYQSTVGDKFTAPFGGYGFEMGFVHYPDNTPGTPRIFDNDVEIWFSESAVCEGLTNCDPNSPPGYRAQSAFIVSRRHARLIGDIYGSN